MAGERAGSAGAGAADEVGVRPSAIPTTSRPVIPTLVILLQRMVLLRCDAGTRDSEGGFVRRGVEHGSATRAGGDGADREVRALPLPCRPLSQRSGAPVNPRGPNSVVADRTGSGPDQFGLEPGGTAAETVGSDPVKTRQGRTRSPRDACLQRCIRTAINIAVVARRRVP